MTETNNNIEIPPKGTFMFAYYIPPPFDSPPIYKDLLTEETMPLDITIGEPEDNDIPEKT